MNLIVNIYLTVHYILINFLRGTLDYCLLILRRSLP
jgi:hypothetical protein